MRLAVYTDYAYHRIGDRVYAERAFALFLAELATRIERMVVIGRLSPGSSSARYDLGEVDFVPLPFYPSLAEPFRAMGAMARSLGGLWRGLDDVDAVWVLGPHLMAAPLALFALLRRRRLILGVRQEYPLYVRNRHPGRRGWHFIADALEGSFRALARVSSVIVVGPVLARSYARSRRLLEIAVSLCRRQDIVEPAEAARRDYSSELLLLSVGRIDTEKNPLLLADALADLRSRDPRWRLVVCGEGPLEDELVQRLDSLGQTGAYDLRGYVPHGDLRSAYEECHVLAHVSLTEGLPQVVLEALAAGLPVVATDVGGIRDALGDAVSLVPSRDAEALAEEAGALGGDGARRAAQVERGIEWIGAHTLESETERVAAFIERGDTIETMLDAAHSGGPQR